jgi:hypothetical protein
MAPVEVADHPASADVQGGEQGGGPVAMVVMVWGPRKSVQSE